MEKEIAYKFVKWEVEPLENLKDSKVYQLKEKLVNGGEMTRKERDWLFSQLYKNSYSKRAVPLMGWSFRFDDWLKTYWVKFSYGDIAEYHSPDKVAIRNELLGVVKIVEVV